MTLRLEVGKSYRDAAGRVWRIETLRNGQPGGYSATGCDPIAGRIRTWALDGRYYSSVADSWDLVAEVVGAK